MKIFGLNNCFDWSSWWHRWYRPELFGSVVSVRARWLHAAVDLAQNEKFDCNLGFSHYSLNAVEVFSAKSWSKTEVPGGRRRRGALHSADEALPGHSVEVKWTAIDRPCGPQLVFILNQPLPLIMSETGIASPNCWWATLLDYHMTWIWAPLKPGWRAKTVIMALHVHEF